MELNSLLRCGDLLTSKQLISLIGTFCGFVAQLVIVINKRCEKLAIKHAAEAHCSRISVTSAVSVQLLFCTPFNSTNLRIHF